MIKLDTRLGIYDPLYESIKLKGKNFHFTIESTVKNSDSLNNPRCESKPIIINANNMFTAEKAIRLLIASISLAHLLQ